MNKKQNIMLVKFGGSSLADASKIRRAAELATDQAKTGLKVIVVVSAMGKTTDQLLEVTNGSSKKAAPEHMDEILSMGERTSARVFATVAAAQGIMAEFLDVDDADWPIITDEKHGDANLLLEHTKEQVRKTIAKRMETAQLIVVPGFIGKTQKGKLTTIGRGGSDTTAFVIGDALGLEEVILVSDVAGVMTADPKTVKNPKLLSKIAVDRLVGLADSGVKFLHKKALSYKNKNLRVKLISNASKTLLDEGTIITGSIPDIEISCECAQAAAVTIVGENISANPGVLSDLLAVFHRHRISLLGMSANHDNLVFYLPESGLTAIDDLHDTVISNSQTQALAKRGGLAVIKINGIGLQETPGSMARATGTLQKNGINIFGQYTVMSEIFVLVQSGQETEAQKLIQKELIGS